MSAVYQTIDSRVIDRASLPQVRFADKMRIVLGCAVAVWVMREVGWLIAAPADPEMGLTFVLSGRAVVTTWLGLAMLSVVTALLGTAISGRRLPEAGVLVACVGLVAMSIKGGTMQQVLAYEAGFEPATRKHLMMMMWIDTLLWSAILLADWVAVSLAYRWLWKSPVEPDQAPADMKPADEGSSPRPGWYAWATTAALGLIALNLIISRTSVSPIVRGQVIGALALQAVGIAMCVRYFLGIHDARWYALAPFVIAMVAYMLGYLNADMNWAKEGVFQPYRDLATTPPHDLVRALPVEFLAVGLAATVFGYWGGEKIEEVAEMEA